MTQPARLLLCTVGTSLFAPNLSTLGRAIKDGSRDATLVPVAEAFARKDWDSVAAGLASLDPQDRLCGAEINSNARLVALGHVAPDSRIVLLHSATADGRAIGSVLAAYYGATRGLAAEPAEIAGLQDEDPVRFRREGLGNLVRAMVARFRMASPRSTAINATGGYKAQIAIGVLVGQALGIPVYYKHERFSEIVSFPPLPMTLDRDVWTRARGMLCELARGPEPIPAERFAAVWEERFESLVDRFESGGRAYIALSPVGQVFLAAFGE